MQATVSRTAARTVECPACGAPAGERCQGARGRPREAKNGERDYEEAAAYEDLRAALRRLCGDPSASTIANVYGCNRASMSRRAAQDIGERHSHALGTILAQP